MGRGRSKHRRVLYSFRFVECFLLGHRGILFDCEGHQCCRFQQMSVTSQRYFYGMDGNLKESTHSLLDGGYAILRPKNLALIPLDIQD